MGIMVYSLLWEMQDLYHQPYPSGTGGISEGEEQHTKMMKEQLGSSPDVFLEVHKSRGEARPPVSGQFES